MADPIVQISDGQLKGCVMSDYDGGNIYAFLGIPYAKPAIGELRFKAPVPAVPWKGIRDATKNGEKCIQRDMFYQFKVIEGSEDCLHLNIYTKQLPSQGTVKLKPVMAWIHGGGYMSGSNRSEMYGPDYLLTEDIVLVTINYRLGVLGFLTVEDPALEVYGNAGLKDQQLALKWIQTNIGAFGGNPDDVTIFGESAGAASVHFHIFSSSSKGLFHKAIMQSGSVLNSWAMQEKPTSVVEFANILGKEVSNDKEALDILRAVSIEELFQAQEKCGELNQKSSAINLTFTPSVEIPNDTAFLTNKPYELLVTQNFNKVPMIFGYTALEGLILDVMMKSLQRVQSVPQPKLENLLPSQIREKESAETIQQLCKKLMEVYFTGENANNKHLMTTDAMFVVGIVNSVKLHIHAETPTYLYRMDIDDDLNLFKIMNNCKDFSGMCHADDLGYLFGNEKVPKAERGSSAETAMRRIVKLWTNFTKYGNPTTDEKELNIIWKPANKETINYLDIATELSAKSDPESDRMKVWNDIMQLLTH